VTIRSGSHRRGQRGVALVLVLWAIALMAVLLGSFALIAHTEQLESRHVFDAVTARYDAQAGLERAVFELRNTDPAQGWIADGRPYEFVFDKARSRRDQRRVRQGRSQCG
jgi:general secretion pathway protein K